MNKTVIITGAAKGIGRAIAKDFAYSGYNVCINYNTSENEAKELCSELAKNGCNVIIYKADITKREKVDKMVEYVIGTFGNIDVLVNNAGISEYKLFIDISEEELQRMLNVNIMGTFNMSQSVLKKSMLPRKDGTIINISSIWGMVGASLEVAYSTSKAAIIGMSKALAKELAPSNITVNVVAPGAISTDMLATLSDEDMKVLKEEIPLGKIGNVEDVAAAVKFLASYEARYITGQVISPNGGLVI